MKRLFILLSVIFFCVGAHADNETINWYVDGNLYTTTTCQTGGDITLPTTPTKYGYTFQGWSNLYTPIEYLESTGTQYIDTGFIPNVDTKVEIKFSNLDVWLLGAVESPGRIEDFGISKSGIRFGTQYKTSLNLDGTRIITVDKDGYSIDGIQTNWTSVPGLQCQKSMYLFWANGSNAARSGRIYYVRIWNNNTLVHDFIPVIDNNNVPCLFDNVTKQFFYNAGTGQFNHGNPI